MDEALLDTDILNEVLKQKSANVIEHAARYLSEHGQFSISAMSRYEVLRGLAEKQATAQLARFTTFCQHTNVVPVSDEVLDRAADLWATGRAQGMAPNDADLIIAATSITHGLSLVTGNLVHFRWIPGLTIHNWRDASSPAT